MQPRTSRSQTTHLAFAGVTYVKGLGRPTRSFPAAMATQSGHCSTSWLPLVKQAAQALLVADDPETGSATFSSALLLLLCLAVGWTHVMNMVWKKIINMKE